MKKVKIPKIKPGILVNFLLDEKLYKKLKVYCAKNNTNMSEILREQLNKVIK